MNDKELLIFAAKAAGVQLAKWVDEFSGFELPCQSYEDNIWWNPLTSDGDSLRLAVKLQLSVNCNGYGACVWLDESSALVSEINKDDPYTATRRAIVLAAAKIGENLK